MMESWRWRERLQSQRRASLEEVVKESMTDILKGSLVWERSSAFHFTSDFKVVLGLGHNCKEEEDPRATAAGLWRVLWALISLFLLGWRCLSHCSFLSSVPALPDLTGPQGPGRRTCTQGCRHAGTSLCFPLIFHISGMEDLALKWALYIPSEMRGLFGVIATSCLVYTF